MKYAIIESGGKQYRAVEGGLIDVDRLPLEVGADLQIDQVLLISDDESIQVGQPTVEGAHVKATVAGQVKGRKILVFKYKEGNRYRRRQGHRQHYTRLQIEKIVTK
jgi:large subunit ribosomal protein L21